MDNMIVGFTEISNLCSNYSINCEFYDQFYSIFDQTELPMLSSIHNMYRELTKGRKIGTGLEWDCDDHAWIYKSVVLLNGYSCGFVLGFMCTPSKCIGHAFNLIVIRLKGKLEMFIVEPQNILYFEPFMYRIDGKRTKNIKFYGELRDYEIGKVIW